MRTFWGDGGTEEAEQTQQNPTTLEGLFCSSVPGWGWTARVLSGNVQLTHERRLS